MVKKKLPSYRIKAKHPGQKCVRDIPTNKYGEIKKDITLSLTPSAQNLLQKFAIKLNCSRSEVIEEMLRFAENNPKSFLNLHNIDLNSIE